MIKIKELFSAKNTNRVWKKMQIITVKGIINIIKEKDNEISILKLKINDLRGILEYLKDRLNKVIYFIHGKIHNWYAKGDKYIDKWMKSIKKK